ncbi:serine/threonine-protein phosphatase 6 regulatory ankyrin repeat subunit C-like [Oratosquilla oratoria]|uniref:serine/threonine-protein phosphatase 6 regulatory ankyrin repeat subunit C-like n=1 Tax=Oratosquilla oratoria TaxID=337810 RepID=UPI003F75B1C1
MGGSVSKGDPVSNQKLVNAVESDNVTAAQVVLRSGEASPSVEFPEELFFSLSREHSLGNSLLHACMYRSQNMLIELLYFGADVDARNSRFETPLHLAAELGKKHLVKLLLEKNSKTSNVDFLNRTAFHRAIISDQVEVLDALKPDKAVLNARDDYGSTPLHYAVAFGSRNAIKWLLERGVDLTLQNSWKQTPGKLASDLGYSKNNISLISGERSRVEHPVKIPQHVELIRNIWKGLPGRLREASLDPISLKKEIPREVWGHDVRRNTLLHLAAARANRSKIQELLSLQASPAIMNSKGETPVHISALLGEDECCQDLLEHERSLVHAVDCLGQSPLHKAVVGGKLSTLHILDRFAADVLVNAPDNEGRTPLHLAVLLERSEIIKWLIDKGASLTLRTQRGKTAADLAESLKWPSEFIAFLKNEEDPKKFHDALENLNMPSCGLLLAVVLGNAKATLDRLYAGGANLNDPVLRDMPNLRALWTIEGNRLLHLAALTSSFFVEKLIEYGSDPKEKNACGEIPLHLAAEAGMYRCVELLLKRGYVNDVDSKGRTPLHRAVMNNHILILEALKKYKADLNATDDHGSTPLHYAVAYGCPEAVLWLLENDVDLTRKNHWGQTPKDLAMKLGYGPYMVELVACPTVKDKNTIEVPVFVELLKAVWEGRLCFSQDIQFPKDLLEKEVPLELWGDDVRNITPLHYVAAHRQPALVEELLNLGASTGAKNHRGETPLHLSSKFGRDGSCRVLVKRHQALVFERDDVGYTPLHKAALNDQCSTMDILKQGQCDINAEDNEGNTALHLAVILGKEEAVKWLIKNGADVSVRTGLGYKASQLAKKAGKMSMAELLRSCESSPSAPVHSEESCAPLYSLPGKEELNLPD